MPFPSAARPGSVDPQFVGSESVGSDRVGPNRVGRDRAGAVSPPPPRADLDPREVDALRADLAEFTVESVEAALGPVAAAALHREQAVPARRVLRALLAGGGASGAPLGGDAASGDRASGGRASGDRADDGPASGDRAASGGRPEPAAVLAALFLLGDEVPRRLVDAALPRTGTEGARAIGLVEAAGNGPDDPVRALIDLRPYSAHDAAGPVTWWLASDLGELATGGSLAPDHVLGAGGASLTLAQVTMRTRVGRVLDLGTGCGIQALHASRHADAVVATDISARALRFAAFNAALDGVRLDLREGSMLGPVAGEQFDLVVSNPPFVITPRGGGVTEYEYRDGGRAGDDVVRDLVRDVGSVLAPGGVAQFLGNWEHRRGEPWAERVESWLDEAGLDGWVVQREVIDPAEYAETWIRDGGTTAERDPGAWEAAYGAWLDDFASRDVEAIGFGIVTLRKPGGLASAGGGAVGGSSTGGGAASNGAASGGATGTAAGDRVSAAASGRPTLRRLEDQLGPVRQPLGAHLAAALAAHDWLTAHDDTALADARLVVAPDVTEERFHTPGAADPTVILLRQGDGFGRAVQATTGLAALVGACDGELTVGQLTGAVATLFEVPAGELSAELLPSLRGLVGDGFLTVA